MRYVKLIVLTRSGSVFTMRLRSASYSVIVLLSILCSAVDAPSAKDNMPPFDVAQWLRGPDRGDFKWEVKVLPPRLTLQQRNLVQVYATVDFSRLPAGVPQGDLHFVIKVADADNHWVPGYGYTRLPPELDGSRRIQYAGGLYLRPGRYTIALIIYDAALRQGNIRRHHVKVPAPVGNLLPELDRDLPAVEFISGVPQEAFDYDHYDPYYPDPLWPWGQGREWLPVKNSRPLNIDVVVDTSDSNGPLAGALHSRLNSSQTLQVSSVISHLRLDNGCIRVSILSALRMKTFFDREDAAYFDWQRAREVVSKQSQITIDAGALSLQAPCDYLLNELNKILEDGDSAPGTESPVKIVIIVSRNLLFAEHTSVRPIVLHRPSSTRFFYFRLTNNIPVYDDLLKMLKPTKARRFFVLEPRSFREALGFLISNLEKIK